MPDTDVTIYHNPRCGTSRTVLEKLRAEGLSPRVVEYLKTPPDHETLLRLGRSSGVGLKGLLRTKEALAEELNLGRADIQEEELLDAMLAHPVLINRPIVETPLGVRLCRPADVLTEILPAA